VTGVQTCALPISPLNGLAEEKLAIKPQWITDLEFSYDLNPVKLSIGANNLFNNYPTKYPQFIRTQQYNLSSTAYITKYPSFSAIGINGGYYYARLSFKF
jgi:iron complex outermembrane receptor protein